MKEQNICLSGSGGQGLILAGKILAKAIIIEGKNVVLTASYGPEARGGASRSNLIISDQKIKPLVPDKIDILLVLNQKSFDKYISELREGGILITDSDYVVCSAERYSIPLTKIAMEEVEKKITANIVALGAISGLTGIVSPESIEEALKETTKKEFLDLNKKALWLGFKKGREMKNL